MRIKILGLLVIVASQFLVGVTVTNVSARQRWPWNGLVDIDYTIAGDTTGLGVSISMKDLVSGKTYMPTKFLQSLPVTAGTHRVTWSTEAEGLSDIVTSQMVATVSLRRIVKEGPYLIIDLTGGPSVRTYQVAEVASAPDGGWTDEYKTEKLVLQKIDSGVFVMGSPNNEFGRDGEEVQHTVKLSKSFWMGVFEITQRQWELVMGTKPSYFSNSSCYASRPVEQVSYSMIRGSSTGAGWPANNKVDAGSFLGILRSKTGMDFDLPTEAQWEYACRAGTTTSLNSGKDVMNMNSADSNMDEVGRYYTNGGVSSGLGPSCDVSAGTAKVGSYAPNNWGLYDMHGNVWEQTLDWSGSYPATTVSDPCGSSSGVLRVKRGGSWGGDATDCRSARRFISSPNAADRGVGFRLCCPTSN